MKVAATKYFFPPESIERVLKQFRYVLESGAYLTMGKHCEEFERKFAEYVGVKYALSMNNGTSALEAIFRAIGVEGAEVVVPTNTFAATAFAVIYAGGRPVFADIGPDLTVDPNDVRKRITDKTKAVVTVHIGGLVSPNTLELMEICEEKGIYLVEDAAHAHGGMLNGKKAGCFGVAAAFSFFTTKVMTTGEGGMITTNNEEIYEKAKLMRDQAKIEGRNFHRELGNNWRMTEFQAIMGLEQLRLLEKMIEMRTKVARAYDDELSGIPKLSLMEIPPRVRPNYYKYIAFLEGYDRDKLYAEMKELGVSMGGLVYEIPLHKQPVFQRYASESLPVSEDLCSRHICPPIYPQLTEEEVSYVASCLRRCLS